MVSNYGLVNDPNQGGRTGSRVDVMRYVDAQKYFT